VDVDEAAIDGNLLMIAANLHQVIRWTVLFLV